MKHPPQIPPINIRTKQQLLADLRERLRNKQGFSVATVNLDHVVKLRTDVAFQEAYRLQTHVVADGNPIVWLQRLTGNEVELVTGSDLVVPLADLAGDLRVSIALLGATQTTLRLAAERLRARRPELRIAAEIAPSAQFDPFGSEADDCLKEVGACGAGLCLVALGAPKQEILAGRGRGALPHVGFVSIGAGLDFVAGTQKRAPRWARSLALEWAWRMLHDWRRLSGRYWRCAAIMPSLTIRALRQRVKRRWSNYQ